MYQLEAERVSFCSADGYGDVEHTHYEVHEHEHDVDGPHHGELSPNELRNLQKEEERRLKKLAEQEKKEAKRLARIAKKQAEEAKKAAKEAAKLAAK